LITLSFDNILIIIFYSQITTVWFISGVVAENLKVSLFSVTICTYDIEVFLDFAQLKVNIKVQEIRNKDDLKKFICFF